MGAEMKIGILAPVFGAVMAAGLASAGTAGAVTTETFKLTVNGCSGSCFAGGVTSLGTVTVTENDGALDFSVQLTDAVFNLAGKSSTHHSLAFSIGSTGAGDPVSDVTISDLTSGFSSSTAGGISDSPFGTFKDAINHVGSSKGNSGSNPSALSFVVSDAAGNLSLSNLTANSISKVGQIYLAADLYANGKTGNVGALGGAIATTTSGTPEPATWAMMLMGIGLAGGALRTRRRVAVVPTRA